MVQYTDETPRTFDGCRRRSGLVACTRLFHQPRPDSELKCHQTVAIGGAVRRLEDLEYLVGPSDTWHKNNRNETKRDRDRRDSDQSRERQLALLEPQPAPDQRAVLRDLRLSCCDHFAPRLRLAVVNAALAYRVAPRGKRRRQRLGQD